MSDTQSTIKNEEIFVPTTLEKTAFPDEEVQIGGEEKQSHSGAVREVDIVTNVNKEPEFRAFLGLVESDELPETWELVAHAIGVHQNTITQWRKTPEFQKALAKGIQKAMQNMESSGRRDWRMWRDKIAILTKEKTTNIGVQNNYVQTNTIVFSDFKNGTKG